MKCYRYFVKIRMLIVLLVLFFIQDINIEAKGFTIEKGNWEKIYNLVKGNKLPILSNEEEEEILKEVDKILKEDKSIYLATLYMVKKVGSYEKGYILYGNPKIKDKLVELLKMRIQCALKRSIRDANLYIDEEIKNLSEKEKKEKRTLLREKCEVGKLEYYLEKLIEKDGDMCNECYIYDEAEYKAMRSGEDEGVPGCYSWDVTVFYSIVSSTFPEDIYEYLWVPKSYSICELHPVLRYLWESEMTFVLLSTIYSERLMREIENGHYKGEFVFPEEWRPISIWIICDILKVMKEVNPGVLEREKEKIRNIKNKIFRLGMDKINSNFILREKILKDKLREEREGDCYYEWIDTYRVDFEGRECILEVYERIGEKEDIENIKKLGEGIAMDYPVRETNREGDEKIKERYLQRVKDLQERVKALVDKLSHQ